jgi:hypothetical protein
MHGFGSVLEAGRARYLDFTVRQPRCIWILGSIVCYEVSHLGKGALGRTYRFSIADIWPIAMLPQECTVLA